MQKKELRPVFWIGDSKKQLLTFPVSVRHEIGFALERAQAGSTHHQSKLLRGFSGVYEIVSNYDRNTYRAIYTVNLGETIYVLHCFQKKSKFRIKTPKREIDLIRRRLNFAKELAQQENEND